jgi:hypothetical protein
MKRLLITLLLVSPFSFAEWGDVYYCQMTSYVFIDSDGTVKQYKPEKFQFKLDSTEKAMVFGKGSYFADSKMTLDPIKSWVTIESWAARDTNDLIRFDKGKLMYSWVGSEKITSISANCDKF